MTGEWNRDKKAKYRIETFCPTCGRLLVSTPDEEITYKTEPTKLSYFMHCPWCNKPLSRIDLYEPYSPSALKGEKHD